MITIIIKNKRLKSLNNKTKAKYLKEKKLSYNVSLANNSFSV